jgi:hypothetical protein
MIGVGFEPTPPKRPVPETGALDRSAIQPVCLAASFSGKAPCTLTRVACVLRAKLCFCYVVYRCAQLGLALIAQLVEHGSNKPRVGGSSPSWSTFFLLLLVVAPPFLRRSRVQSVSQSELRCARLFV